MSRSRDHIRRRVTLLNNRIDAISWDAIVRRIRTWAARGEARYICLCNLQTLLHGRRDIRVRRAIGAADTSAPADASVAWLMRRHGVMLQERIDGADLLRRYAERAAIDRTPTFFYGATSNALVNLISALRYSFPGLNVVGAETERAPEQSPFARDDQVLIDHIVTTGARVVFVGLDTPYQEIWLAKMHRRISAVLVGIGVAAFSEFARHSSHQPSALDTTLGIAYLERSERSRYSN